MLCEERRKGFHNSAFHCNVVSRYLDKNTVFAIAISAAFSTSTFRSGKNAQCLHLELIYAHLQQEDQVASALHTGNSWWRVDRSHKTRSHKQSRNHCGFYVLRSRTLETYVKQTNWRNNSNKNKQKKETKLSALGMSKFKYLYIRTKFSVSSIDRSPPVGVNFVGTKVTCIFRYTF